MITTMKSMINADFDEMKFTFRGLRFGALFVLTETTWRRIVISFLELFFTILQILVIVHMLTTRLVISSHVTATAAFLSNSLQSSIRHAYLIARRKQIYELVDCIRSSPCYGSAEVEAAESEMRMRSTKQVYRYSAIIVLHHASTALVSSFCIFALPSFLKNKPEEQRLPLYSEMWFPLDLNQYYVYVLIWQGITVVVNVISAVTTDAFTCALMLAASERSLMLARIAPTALIPSVHGDITPDFQAWVKHHQHYLSVFGRVNSLMGPIIFNVHLFGIINIIAFSYLIMKVDVPSMMVALAHLTSVVLQLYTFDNAGQRVIDNSEELGRNTLSTAQVVRGGLRNSPARSALLVLVARCSGARPEELSGMGYFTVSIPLFSAVVGASMSFLLVLMQFK